jgi:hypothetical protein
MERQIERKGDRRLISMSRKRLTHMLFARQISPDLAFFGATHLLLRSLPDCRQVPKTYGRKAGSDGASGS